MKNTKSARRFTFSPDHFTFPCLPMGRVPFFYEDMGIDAMRRQVVRNAVSHFGRLLYNTVMFEFQDVVTARHKESMTTSFADYEGWMSEHEIWGLGQIVPLAIEWGLDKYIEDWEKPMDEWLDLFPTLQEAA